MVFLRLEPAGAARPSEAACWVLGLPPLAWYPTFVPKVSLMGVVMAASLDAPSRVHIDHGGAEAWDAVGRLRGAGGSGQKEKGGSDLGREYLTPSVLELVAGVAGLRRSKVEFERFGLLHGPACALLTGEEYLMSPTLIVHELNTSRPAAVSRSVVLPRTAVQVRDQIRPVKEGADVEFGMLKLGMLSAALAITRRP